MTATPNLNITNLDTNQQNKEVSINDAILALEQALTEATAIDLSAGNHTVTTAEFTRAVCLQTTGNAISRSITVPQLQREMFLVKNGGSATLSIIRGSTTLTLAAGAYGFFATDGTTNGLVAFALVPSFATLPYTIAFFVPGAPTSSQLVMQFCVTHPFTLLAGLADSGAKAGVASTGTATFDIKKNGSDGGDIVFTSSAQGTFTYAGNVSFVAGDLLQIVAPASPDGTLADISITLIARRD